MATIGMMLKTTVVALVLAGPVAMANVAAAAEPESAPVASEVAPAPSGVDGSSQESGVQAYCWYETYCNVYGYCWTNWVCY